MVDGVLIQSGIKIICLNFIMIFNLIAFMKYGSTQTLNLTKKPSLDHIVPKAKGGTNDLENLQFLSWFENRCKNDMTQDEWNILKSNIGEYLI